MSQGSMAAMVVQILVGLVIPLTLFFYYRKTNGISYRALGVGILVFIVFSQLLEKGLHVYVLKINSMTAEWLKNPWLFAVYGALAAGVFEEIGRWLGFSFPLKRRQERKDGLSLGIGHGGIEAILIAVAAGVQGLVFATMINAGTLEQTLGASLPADQIAQLKQQLVGTAQSAYWLGAFERVPALFMQIAFSLIVLYGIRRRNFIYLLYAIGLHALVDFVPAMYQAHVMPLWAAECVIWLWGIGAMVVIVKSKDWFAHLPSRRA